MEGSPGPDGCFWKIVLNLGDHYTNPRGYTTSKRPVPGQLLIHELVHAWQYHNNAAAISYVGDALWARIREDYDPGKVLTERRSGGR